jgi:transposase
MEKILKQCAGIDCSKDELVVTAGRLFSDLSVELRGTHCFSNNKRGFVALIKWIDKLTGSDRQTVFVLEATGVYHELLTLFLADSDKEVSVLLPTRAKAFSKTLSCKTITDRTASESLCILGLQRKLERWQKPDPVFMKLRSLCREKEQLIKERTALTNQLHASRHSAYAVAEIEQRIKKRAALIGQQLQQIQKQLKDLLQANPLLQQRVKVISSINAIGTTTAVTVLAETLGFALIRNRRQLASYAGYDVITKESGTSVKKPGRMSRKGNRHLRRAMYMPALTAINCNTAMKQLYNRLLQRHGIKKKALAAVQRKLLLLVYTIWKSGTNYQDGYQANNPKFLEQPIRTALTELA